MMITLLASKAQLQCIGTETLTSGSRDVYRCQFQFSSDWEGLERTAVFRAGGETAGVLLDSSDQCQIPWEVLKTPKSALYAGVFGTRNGEQILPTVWAELGIVQEGTAYEKMTKTPTPNVYDQVLAMATEARDTARQLTDAAEAGQFDGADGRTPVKGVDYFTAEDQAGLVSAVVTALPKYAGEVLA